LPTSLALATDRKVAEATHVFLDAKNSLTDHHHQWSTCLALLKEDHTDCFFRMAFYHYQYQRARNDIAELEALQAAHPMEVD
jgi:hypothetical protein